MFICPKCGQKIKHGGYCEKCGTHLEQKTPIRTCPKCGHKARHGEYCINCGVRLESGEKIVGVAKPSPPLYLLVIPILIGLMIILALIGAVILFGGFLQTSTSLPINIKVSPMGCAGQLEYSVNLKDNEGAGLGGQYVSVYVDGTLVDKLKTDQNGLLSTTHSPPAEWCGKKINFTANYSGDFFHKPTFNSSVLIIQIPTSIRLSAPNQTVNNSETKVNVTLTSALDNKPLGNKRVIISNGASEEITTNTQGYAEATLAFNQTGTKRLKASFSGDEAYKPSESANAEITVIPESCNDGTYIGECSKQVSYYCTLQKELVFDCTKCSCGNGLICSGGKCITPEQQKAELIANLEQNVMLVLVEWADYLNLAWGSGIVMEQKQNQTIILTNRHVINEADALSGIRVVTRNNQSIRPTKVLIAPNDMDFAVLYVPGTIGKTVQINYTAQYLQGQNVVAIGTPKDLSLQGSVSDGIISNFVSYTTTQMSNEWNGGANYKFNTIQTDAAINPGNSGGGLFAVSTGDIIGINTFILTKGGGSEGIGFAIDIKELQKLPSYDSWQSFSPISKCNDGTHYGQCSQWDIGYYCSGGQLVPECKTCGCPNDYPLCSSQGFCFFCPSGYRAYDDGTCCAPGYYWVERGICCPVGSYYQDGSCYYY